ncbi:MFS transporter [Burkholderia anthina]|uniref:MFS transporter n=1 Tax=Burkholderia anthina TaxID=179879 RepID=UPI001AA02063|nr:MFS transporter [Burkholderia anthina]QTD94937.1 MFS transporter [Burkholderia anthina]
MSVAISQRINVGIGQTVTAGASGMFLEFYEYGIYGTFAPVISKVFFTGDAISGLLLTYGIFAVTFLFRPVGGAVLGALGDRLGRKAALLISLSIISVATTLIGLLPGYATIGIAAPILLTLCRLAQGFSAGGETSAAVTLIGEQAPPNRRAYYVSFIQSASFLALLSGTLIGILLSSTLTDEALRSWGWRVPFLLALPLGAIGLWIRHDVPESKAFEELSGKKVLEANPLKAAVGSGENRRLLFLAMTVPMLNNIGYYVLFNYLPTYLSSKSIGFSPAASFAVTSIGLAALIVTIPFAARVADRFGRRPALICSSLAMALCAYPAYLGMQQKSLMLAIVGILLLAVIFAGNTGVIHTVLMEMFPPAVRTTSYALGYNVGLAIFGGAGPLLVTLLIGRTGNPAIPAYYITFAALVTSLFTLFLAETGARRRRA